MSKKKRPNKIAKPTEPLSETDEMKKDLADYMSIDILGESEGGQILKRGLLDDIMGAIDALTGGADKLTHVQMILLCAKLKERLDLVRLFTNAKTNKEFLEDELKKMIDQPEE